MLLEVRTDGTPIDNGKAPFVETDALRKQLRTHAEPFAFDGIHGELPGHFHPLLAAVMGSNGAAWHPEQGPFLRWRWTSD